MSDILKVLTRKNSLRKQCQELSIADVEKVIADLTDILAEKQEEEQKLAAENQAKNEKIEMIRKTMQDAGIDFNDLQDLISVAPKKKVEAKYRITDEEGNTHEWSGRGRTPVVFQAYFDKHGVDKEAVAIK
ncbi:H-NS family nucleoid-associated regulatory protein [Neptunomonas phycophila]|jgi:DNA-binding protein H-NS|uniref:DNA-binding protein n=1 Tax=Neptunomonas phycophila TaxID=1572645 RepID=A0AAW7XJJ3_9GAMM|nr:MULTISPECIES: H-NS family nucleoid-associated regulatory protein [Neptunomonas]MBT3144169.1 H-NS histone family protein [Neptunomonas phycophila]MDN2661107.1 H-NS family nucleoid-associated regulatory protein [Neptunomonas sp. CHC150]MDO6454382.1 H-NS family nucleoid-associated regulatory protein [Neptunomonas phycophila]MDO6467238.1 H-NS family nucleoid-associated regulatory protein [Neptunomonas phycophila]MDO6782650.1 H-NS family nucleoid-associated regulatory protein [Neptunomonas phyco